VRTQSEHDSQLLSELGEVLLEVERLRRRTQEAERRDLETSEELQVTSRVNISIKTREAGY
jgi:hypothetical protein